LRLEHCSDDASPPLHLLLGPSRLTSPKCRVFVDYLVEQWRAANPFGARHASDPSE
jgi:hypothetical protein